MSLRLFKIKEVKEKFEEVLTKNLSKKIQEDDVFAQALYASLCNTVWFNKSTDDIYSCSWRYAGGFVANIRDKGEDYMDFYCSGGEGCYHSEVNKELNKIGYSSVKEPSCGFIQEYKFK